MTKHTVMLSGKGVSLRPVLARDVDRMYEIHMDISNRGEFWPLDLTSEVAFKRDFNENGFWTDERGLLVMVDENDQLVGDIGFFRPVPYFNATLEIFYRVYDDSQRGKGVTTEALGLLVRYLFDTKTCERIQLGIDTENGASRRVAEKAGFSHEGTMRSPMFHRGRHHDMEIYSILRGEAAKS
jgi:ribosomal-protein-alanine N-acetyltransferase